MQEVSGVYTLLLLDTNELKMVLRSRTVSGAFEKEGDGAFSPNFRNFFGPSKPSLVSRYLKTENCIRLKLLV